MSAQEDFLELWRAEMARLNPGPPNAVEDERTPDRAVDPSQGHGIPDGLKPTGPEAEFLAMWNDLFKKD